MPKVLNFRTDNLPKDSVYVGRPSSWGNPFKLSCEADRENSIWMFREYAKEQLAVNAHWLDPLKGKDLVCWCSPKPCHADVLLELANKEVSE